MNQAREQLHSKIWQIANDLRGSVDGWEFKSYILGLLCYRSISENLVNYINNERRQAGATNFDYAAISDQTAELDRAAILSKKGFYLLPSQLFSNLLNSAKNDRKLNARLSNIFNAIENSAQGLAAANIKGLFADIDLNSHKLGATLAQRNQLLAKIMTNINALQLVDYQNDSIDTFGDAYEFLLSIYAKKAGKSGGEFFTPQQVSELLAQLTLLGKKQVNKVYDPACGSGSLLLKFAKVLGKDNVLQGFYGQEKNISSYNLCRINMLLHDINYRQFNIAHGDTLLEPMHRAQTPFDAIVSNPPYSIKWDTAANPWLLDDPRFAAVGLLAPKLRADLAFVLHILNHLSDDGTAAIVQFPGVLYRGGAEQKIRQYLVDNNYIDAVIQLPKNLFFGVTIDTCILLLKKNKSQHNIIFIDAAAEFVQLGNKNVLATANRQKILTSFSQRKNSKNFARLVENTEIAENNYNLAVANYVEKVAAAQLINIQELNQEILTISLQQNILRAKVDTTVMQLEAVNELNRLGQLISQLCPAGVEYKKLADVCAFQRGTSISKKNTSKGDIPVIAAGKQPACYHNAANRSGETIALSNSGNNAGFVSYWDVPVFLSDSFSIKPNTDLVLTKYLYYFLKAKQGKISALKKGVAVQHLDRAALAQFKLPMLPLAIQQQIITLIEGFVNFLELLQLEITARRKQYQQYLNQLLSFAPDEVPWRRLGDLCQIGDGIHGTPSYAASGEYYFINGNNLTDGKISFFANTKKVTAAVFAQYGINFSADKTVFMSINGTIGKLALFNNEAIVLGKSVAFFNIGADNLLNKYLFYLLQSDYSLAYYQKNSSGAIMKNLALAQLRQYQIPLPPLSRQAEIVALLDQFDRLINTGAESLSLQLERRQKQYQYYLEYLFEFNSTNI